MHTSFLNTFQPDVEAGDVIIVLQQKEHEKYVRDGSNLVCTHTLSLTEALCGFEICLKQLDGRDLLIKNPAGQVVYPGRFGQIVSDMHL